MLGSFHPSVSTLLAKTVLAHVEGGEPPAGVTHFLLEAVAPLARVFHVPLFRGSILVAFFVKYKELPVVFGLIQKTLGSHEPTEEELDDAQNQLHDCMINIDRMKPSAGN